MKIKYLYLFAIAFMTLLFACTKDQNIQKSNRTVSDQALIDYISDGNSKRDIEIKGSYVILDGCTAINIAEIEKEMIGAHYQEPVKILAPDGEQYVEMEQVLENRNRTFAGGVVRPFLNPHMYDSDKIKYFLLPSINDDDDSDGKIGYCSRWKSHIISAANEYNKLGTRIVFEKVEKQDEADLIIGGDEDDFFNTNELRDGYYKVNPGYIAVAAPPISGKPGKYISVNNDNKYISSRHLKPAIMHELGHTLGFHHTDNADKPFQTCGHFYDYNFNADASLYNSWIKSNFHHTDIKSIRQLWPKELKRPVEVSVKKSNDHQLVFKLRNPDEINNPYSRVHITYRSNNIGLFYGKTLPCAKPDEHGYYTITWDETDKFRPGTRWDFWVRGLGHETMGQLPESYGEYVGSIN